MKFRSLVVVILLAVVFAIPAVAQEKYDPTADMRLILTNLRLQPLTDNICTAHERYSASERLEKSVEEDPALLKRLNLSPKELETLRLHEARRLAAKISQIFKHNFQRRGYCSYDEPLGPESAVIYTSLDSNNDYELVMVMKNLIKKWADKGLYEGKEELAAPYQVDEALIRYAVTQGPRLVKVCLDQTITSDKARLAVWRLIAEGHVAPSLIPGLTPELLYQLMNQFGRRQDGSFPSLSQFSK